MYGVFKIIVKLNAIYLFLCEAQNFLISPRKTGWAFSQFPDGSFSTSGTFNSIVQASLVPSTERVPGPSKYELAIVNYARPFKVEYVNDGDSESSSFHSFATERHFREKLFR